MKKIVYFTLSFVFIAFFASFSAVHALEISNIRFGQQGNATRIVLDLDKEADFKVSTKENPLGINIDLPMLSGQPIVKRGDLPTLIKDIRVQPVAASYSRLSLKLNKKAVIRSAFLIPSSGSKSARLVIDLAPTNDKGFAAQLSRTHGTLQMPDESEKLPFVRRGAGTKLQAIGTPEKPKTPESPATPDKPAPQQVPGTQKTEPTPEPSADDEKPLIMLDPGHGGLDPGASGGGIHEKDLTLNMAKKIRDHLLATKHYDVKMTREKDVFIRLKERVRIARSEGADLFVSIHADSVAEHGQYIAGSSIYTLSNRASDEQTARLAAKENQADLLAGVTLPSDDKEVASILIDLAMRETTSQSKFFATSLVSTMTKHGLKLLPNPHRYAGFVVLKAPDIPSTLIELGFLSNSKEAKKLQDDSYQDKLAKSIAEGIDAYFQAKTNN